MKLSASITLCLLLSSHILYAGEEYRLRISVLSGKSPLSGAQVFLPEKKIGAFTNKEGRVEFILPSGNSHIAQISYPGMISQQIQCKEQDSLYIVELKPAQDIITKQLIVQANKEKSGIQGTGNIQILQARELDEHRGQTLGETLRDQPGITTLQTGPSISKPVLRGLHSQRLLITNAGVQQEGQQWGAEHAPEIDPFAAGSIQIIRGAAGVEYGAGAMAGMIKVEPAPLLADSGWSGNLNIQGFSNNRQLAGAVSTDIPLQYITNGLAMRAQASTRRAGDSKTSDYILDNTGFTELNSSLLFSLAPPTAPYSIKAYFSHFGSQLGILKASHIGNATDLQRAIQRGRPGTDAAFSYAIDPPRQEILHNLWSVQADYTLADLGTAEIQYGWQFNQRREFDAHNFRIPKDSVQLLEQALLRPAMQLQLQTYSTDIKFRHSPISGMITGSAGVSIRQQENARSGRVFLIPDYTSLIMGFYVKEQITFEKSSFSAGIRYDNSRLSTGLAQLPTRTIPDTNIQFSSVSGAVGAIIQPDTNVQISINAGSGWRAPHVNELFSNDVHHGTAQFEKGDPALKPERSYTIDLNALYTTTTFHISMSLYSMWYQNFIYLFPDIQNPTVTVRGTFPTFFYTQSNARIYGAEAMIEVHPFSWLRTTFTASALRGDNLSNGQPLFMMPSDRIRAAFHMHTEKETGWYKEIYAEISPLLVAQQQRFQPMTDYAAPPPGYWLLDCSAGITFGEQFMNSATVSINMINVLNQDYRDYLSRYRYFAADPGFNFILKVSVPFGTHS
jgi:iron complex outermembrane receptor protein